MKKRLFAIAMALLCSAYVFDVYAQYNKTYFASIGGGTALTNGEDIVDAGNGTYCVLSTTSVSSLLLRKHDFNGNIIFETAYEVPQHMHAMKLLHTANDEYLVVGFHRDLTGIYNPFAARFDNSGNFLWLYIYQSNSTPGATHNPFGRVNVVKAEDDANESYIIVAPGDQLYATALNQDVVVNAIKIRANGWPLWNYKYAMSSTDRNGTYGSVSSIIDQPHALCYGTDGRKHKYFIAGATLKHSNQSRRSFHFSIDGNGVMTDPYQEYFAPGYAMCHDAIFDNASNEYVMTITQGNNKITGTPVFSQTGVIKYDFNSLGINEWRYYYDADATENYGQSIKQTADHNNYIISGFVSNPLSPNQMIVNGSLLKLDKIGNVIYRKRYNVNVETQYNSIISLVDGSGTENYVLNGSAFPGASGDNRIASTDVNGSTCGEHDIPTESRKYAPSVNDYPYKENWLDPPYYALILSGKSVSTIITDCNHVPDPAQYRTHLESEDVNNNISIYPTSLQPGSNMIWIDVLTDHTLQASAMLFAIDGKLVSELKFDAETGNNKQQWHLPSLAAGTYALHISSNDGTALKRYIISKL